MCFLLLCFCLLKSKFTLLEFGNKPQKSCLGSWSSLVCVYWHLIMIEEAYEFGIHYNTNSIHQLIFEHSIKLDNLETKDSLNGQT